VTDAPAIPVLVTRVADVGEREYLRGVAHAGGSVVVRLVTPPADRSLHVLEVHVPGAAPVELFAEPMGPPAPNGCLLRLRPREAPSSPPAGVPVPDLVLDVPRASPRPTEPLPASASSIPDDLADGDWLQHGSDYLSAIPPAMPAPASQEPPGDPARALTAFLQKLAQTIDPAQFAALVAPLGPRVASLLAQRQTGPLWRIRSTLDLIARDPPGPGSRAGEAKEALEIFRHPDLLAPLAEKVLDGLDDSERAASRLVVRAGKRGANALYQARMRRASPEARACFVALLQEIGAPGIPVLVKALEHLQSRLVVPGAVEILEDVLQAVPPTSDEVLAGLVALYATSDVQPLAVAAANALTRIA
jgi:hypothetical protein